MRVFLVLIAALAGFAADAKLTPEMQEVLNRVSAESLRGHLSFIASDLLEGRATPSRGLDVAAEYIAAQFRRAGLEPAGGDGYFQTATVIVREPNWEGFKMTVTAGDQTIDIGNSEIYLLRDGPLDLDNVPIVAIDNHTAITPELVQGKVIVASNRGGQLRIDGAALLLISTAQITAAPQIADPEVPARAGPSIGAVAQPQLAEFLKDAKDPRVSIHMAAPIEHSVKVRNVAGLLRGSDPALGDTYVMLTAHYDHIGTRSSGEDRVYNGANDDGSGTVSVIEIASALAAANPRPKRSILFVTFFGEERGLLGSRYYSRHPIVPPEKTIGDLNLEQVGRTDASNGPQINSASITGFDFSGLPQVLADAGQLAGIKVYKDDQASDRYFSQSDNQALADIGVPAHTLCIAFNYPDYHGAGDHWEKIDYDNMARVDRAIALGLMRLASDAPPPHWNQTNPAAKRYVEAEKKLHH